MLEFLIPSVAGAAGISILGYKKKEEIKKRSGEAEAAAAVTGFLVYLIVYSIINLIIFFVTLYIVYWNNAFVFKCKNGSVMHWIFANMTAIFYLIYRLIFEKCNYNFKK